MRNFTGPVAQRATHITQHASPHPEEGELPGGVHVGEEAVLGEPVERADADYVRAHTGFAIGGVPPIAHPAPLRTLLDEALLAYAEVWAAAGTPRTVFPVAPARLAEVTGARVAALAAARGR